MLLLFWLCLAATLSFGQQTYTVSGYVTDSLSGESLIGAGVYLGTDPSIGAVTNNYGFFSLRIPVGKQVLVFTYLGYEDLKIPVVADSNLRMSPALNRGVTLNEIVVREESAEENLEETKMGTLDLSIENIQQLPALFGEVDVLKTLQLLPGVLSAGEGNAGFYVRGGGPDQNLVLLDEAVVYNPGHLLGFFSVFNADAIHNTTLIKGGMPAQYGGRLSSVVDIQMKEGNDRDFLLNGGIGLIASRLTVEGPLSQERSSFILSGRRTYALDLAQPFINDTDFAGTNYFFYDVNAKINHRFSDQDRLFLSAYFGRDVLKFKNSVRDFRFDLPYGNTTATMRWNHLFGERTFMNLSVIYNDYDFGFNGGQAEWVVDVISGVQDVNLKLDFDYFPSPDHQVKYGANYTYHKLTPSIATASNGEIDFSNEKEPAFAHEMAFYVADDVRLGSRLAVNAGLRLSIFSQLGPYTGSDGRTYGRGETVQTYAGLEPRLTTRFSLNDRSSLKAAVTRSMQYLHLVSNSTSTLPADVWVSSTERVKPQIGWQYALGYFRNIDGKRYESSIEVYYKRLQNQIDYPESYVNNAANDLDQEFVFGSGRSYGAEFFIRKNEGRLTGWIGYTLSRTDRTFPDINEGQSFPAVFDRRHDLAIVTNYQAGRKWSLGANFVFGSGNAFTPVRSLYFIDQNLVTEFGARNSARVQDYHRIDLAASFTPRPDARGRLASSWSFSVYNVYNRRNPFFIYYDLSTDSATGSAEAKAIKVSLFPVIPSITWNFSYR